VGHTSRYYPYPSLTGTGDRKEQPIQKEVANRLAIW
jgi:hypothetical protein